LSGSGQVIEPRKVEKGSHLLSWRSGTRAQGCCLRVLQATRSFSPARGYRWTPVGEIRVQEEHPQWPMARSTPRYNPHAGAHVTWDRTHRMNGLPNSLTRRSEVGIRPTFRRPDDSRKGRCLGNYDSPRARVTRGLAPRKLPPPGWSIRAFTLIYHNSHGDTSGLENGSILPSFSRRWSAKVAAVHLRLAPRRN
jgi:hypothetical protein